jgi:hypothetical protein
MSVSVKAAYRPPFHQFATGSPGQAPPVGFLPLSGLSLSLSPPFSLPLSGAGAGAAREWAGVAGARAGGGEGEGGGVSKHKWLVSAGGDDRPTGIAIGIGRGASGGGSTDDSKLGGGRGSGEMPRQGRLFGEREGGEGWRGGGEGGGDAMKAGIAQSAGSWESSGSGAERGREEGGRGAGRQSSVLEDCPSHILSPPSPANTYHPPPLPASSHQTHPPKALRLPMRLPPPPPPYTSPPVLLSQPATPHPSLRHTPAPPHAIPPPGHGLSANGGVNTAHELAKEGDARGVRGAPPPQPPTPLPPPPHQLHHQHLQQRSPSAPSSHYATPTSWVRACALAFPPSSRASPTESSRTQIPPYQLHQKPERRVSPVCVCVCVCGSVSHK